MADIDNGVADATTGPLPVSDAETKLDAIIATWLDGNIFNSPMSQDTPAYTHLVSVLPALKAAILKGN